MVLCVSQVYTFCLDPKWIPFVWQLEMFEDGSFEAQDFWRTVSVWSLLSKHFRWWPETAFVPTAVRWLKRVQSPRNDRSEVTRIQSDAWGLKAIKEMKIRVTFPAFHTRQVFCHFRESFYTFLACSSLEGSNDECFSKRCMAYQCFQGLLWPWPLWPWCFWPFKRYEFRQGFHAVLVSKPGVKYFKCAVNLQALERHNGFNLPVWLHFCTLHFAGWRIGDHCAKGMFDISWSWRYCSFWRKTWPGLSGVLPCICLAGAQIMELRNLVSLADSADARVTRAASCWLLLRCR